MTPALKIAITNLYATFSHYPFRPEIEGCPCCVSAQDQRKLSAKDPFLRSWSIDVNDHRFRNLIHFILSNYHELIERKSHFKEFDPASINKLLSWIVAKKELLEQGFYHFESTDPVFAKEISDALYLLDWVLWSESK